MTLFCLIENYGFKPHCFFFLNFYFNLSLLRIFAFLYLFSCHVYFLTKMLVTAAKLIGGGAAAAGVGGAGAGIGAVFAGFVIGLSRNPSLEQVMFRFTILGFALSEATALFALMMSFLILFTFLQL